MKIADLEAMETGTCLWARRNPAADWEPALFLGLVRLGRRTVVALDIEGKVWRRPPGHVKPVRV